MLESSEIPPTPLVDNTWGALSGVTQVVNISDGRKRKKHYTF